MLHEPRSLQLTPCTHLGLALQLHTCTLLARHLSLASTVCTYPQILCAAKQEQAQEFRPQQPAVGTSQALCSVTGL